MKTIIALLSLGSVMLTAGAAQAQITPTNQYSYVGVAGNVGLTDPDRSVADDGVTVISKIAILNNLSFRPGVNFGGDTSVTLPITYDFAGRGRVNPYIGGGIVTDSGDTDALATGGFDYRFSRDFVGNVGLNVGFADDADVGLTLGVGYVFPQNR